MITVQRIPVIVGPTASGKSALAVRLARLVAEKKPDGWKGAEIVSADSRQIYCGLDIGTGKITGKEMRGVRHHLLDVADPRPAAGSARSFSAEKYRRLARRAIAGITGRGNLPIVCGGTGLYIDAIFNNGFPAVKPNAALRRRLAGKTAPQLLAMLKKLDSKRAAAIAASRSERMNKRRIVRALEISAAGKQTGGRKIFSETAMKPVLIGIKLQRHELRRRIRARLGKRLSRGMIAEARGLHGRRSRRNPYGGISWKRMDELGLEYRYLAMHLRGLIDLKEMEDALAAKIWQYAKRQMTWWRRNKDILWIKPAHIDRYAYRVLSSRLD